LHEALEDPGWRLVFYPHYGTQPFLHLFEGLPDCIVLANRHEFDVQQLLKESKVLVTDFSSVSFDFAYMRKPVVYLLPDEEEYFGGHFQRGYFDFDEDGFGPVSRDPGTAAHSTVDLIRSSGTMPESYRRRVDGFFAHTDPRNCQRTLDAVIGICDGERLSSIGRHPQLRVRESR